MHPAIRLLIDLRARGITLVPSASGHVRVAPSDQLTSADRDNLRQYHASLFAIIQNHHILCFESDSGMTAEVTINQCSESDYLTAQTVWMFPLPPGTIAHLQWYRGTQLLREEHLMKTSTMPRPKPPWLV